MSGRVVHFEIPFDDGERARGFYRDAFGWTLQSMPGMGYTLATTGPVGEYGAPTEAGFINGGMADRQVLPSAGPLLVIEVPSVDDALATVEKLGGSTVRAKEAVGDMGFAGYATDPEGNVIGLWETASG
jgi:hypothetical protein